MADAGDDIGSGRRAAADEVPLGRGLSTRLVILTILFVMLAEVLIFLPSVANFRLQWLEQRLATAAAASAVLMESGPQAPSRSVQNELLRSLGAKAIAVRGSRPPGVADPAGLLAANRALIARSTGPATLKYRQLGTPANLLTFDRLGVLPTRNFQQATFAGAEAVSGEELHQTHLARTVGCASCTVGCEHLYRTLDEDGEVVIRLPL